MMKHNGRAVRKAIAVAFTMSVISVLGAGTASATHTHSMRTGNGSCVLLAQNGGEDQVVLPFVTTDPGRTRSHPLHVLVHTGEPGGHIAIGVFGTASDPCSGSGNYLND